MPDVLNITNGDYFNEYFLKTFGGAAVPFSEAMMDGKTVSQVYSDEFIELRSRELGVSEEEYKSKMHVYYALIEGNYSELRLWFGKDTFCQANLLTLLAYLEEIGYDGRVILNYIDDESFEVLEENIPVALGSYKQLYEDILITRTRRTELYALVFEAFELFFDYLSDDGALSRLVRENSHLDDTSLICLLLENSKEYGLSDIQARKLIEKYRTNQRTTK